MNIKNNVTELIGNTPLMELKNLEKSNAIKATLLGKLEYFNPAGSIKDRAVLSMINDYEERGIIKAGATIIEPTSGNTGIALASISAARNYRAVIVMPDTMSIERRNLIAAYGAQIVLTAGAGGMKAAIEKAEQLNKETPNSVILGQFDNPANAKAHIDSTGPEIWNDTDGKVDIVVMGIGSAGTVSGIGEFMKSKNEDIRIIGVEPYSSPLISQGKSGAHKLQGIGANFIPSLYKPQFVDEIITVSDEDAYKTVNAIAKCEGVLVGITAGAAVRAAIQLALREENAGKTIVAVMPDTGERYMSVEGLFCN